MIAHHHHHTAAKDGYYHPGGDYYGPAPSHQPPTGPYFYGSSAHSGHHASAGGYTPVVVNVGSAPSAPSPGSTLARLEGMEAELEALKQEQTEGAMVREEKIKGAMRMTEILTEGIEELKGQLASMQNNDEATAQPRSSESAHPAAGYSLQGGPWGVNAPPNFAYARRVPWEVMSRAERSNMINRMYDDPYSLRVWLDQVTTDPTLQHQQSASAHHTRPSSSYYTHPSTNYPPPPSSSYRPAGAGFGYGPVHEAAYHRPRVGGAYPDGRYV